LTIGIDGEDRAFVAEICGSPDELFQLGLALRNQDSIERASAPLEKSAYPRGLKGLRFDTECFEPDYIHLTIESDVLRMKGSPGTRVALGKSLTNCFEGPQRSGYHIHVDHLGGLGLIATSERELIFTVV